MKKVLFSTVAMSALMLMATSCADDQTSDLKAGAESTVTITAQLPGERHGHPCICRRHKSHRAALCRL